MTTPSSGPISAKDLNKLLFRSSLTSPISLGDPALKALIGSTARAISFDQLYGVSNSMQSTYTSVGTYTYTVPNLTTALTINSVTVSGLTSTALTGLTVGQVLTVTIGNFGSASQITDASNNVLFSSAAYEQNVFSFSGNIDQNITLIVTLASSVASGTFNFNGRNSGSITAAAQADGLTYDVVAQYFHGDLVGTVSFAPLPYSTIINAYQVVTSSWSGVHGGNRPQYAEYSLGTAYNQNGQILVQVSQSDSLADEGTYGFTLQLQQIVPITITANA
jgi:hypothetical protein